MEKTERLMKFLYFLSYLLLTIGFIIAVIGCITNVNKYTFVSMIIIAIASLIGNKADTLKEKNK